MFTERRITRRKGVENAINKGLLEPNRINATIRREMGADINAACGQLRKKFMETSKTL